MSGDRPNQRDLSRPVHGAAAGCAYLALPPTAVDARPAGPTRLIVAWPGFDPPRSAAALATAMPMTGVPVWRVFLELPAAGRAPAGLGSGAMLESEYIEAYGAAIETAVERFPDALAEIRRDLGVADGPVGLAGFSAGGSAALLALAGGTVPVSAAAVVAPVVAPSRAAGAVEKRAGRERSWSDAAHDLAGRLDLGTRAAEIAGRDAALLLVAGGKDRVVPPTEVTTLRDLLRRCGAAAVDSATFRMGHALAAEPGTDASPPTTEAVRVDAALTDWFREHLAETVAQPDHAPAAADTPPAAGGSTDAAPAAVPACVPPAPRVATTGTGGTGTGGTGTGGTGTGGTGTVTPHLDGTELEAAGSARQQC